jgi:ABC-type branched-subunit amino acid transport system ATPase component
VSEIASSNTAAAAAGANGSRRHARRASHRRPDHPLRRLDRAQQRELRDQREEVRAIIGPNGAGKSTFFNCLTGVLRPTSGRILFNGDDITGLPPNRISKKGIARSYQITNILPNATALENVRIAAQSRRHGWSMFRHYRAFGDIMEKAEAVLKSVGLAAKTDELACNLSHGEQRNLEIGIALATEPQLLCLDEPTAGMSTPRPTTRWTSSAASPRT